MLKISRKPDSLLSNDLFMHKSLLCDWGISFIDFYSHKTVSGLPVSHYANVWANLESFPSGKVSANIKT